MVFNATFNNISRRVGLTLTLLLKIGQEGMINIDVITRTRSGG
jgi:hypothetical protein